MKVWCNTFITIHWQLLQICNFLCYRNYYGINKEIIDTESENVFQWVGNWNCQPSFYTNFSEIVGERAPSLQKKRRTAPPRVPAPLHPWSLGETVVWNSCVCVVVLQANSTGVHLAVDQPWLTAVCHAVDQSPRPADPIRIQFHDHLFKGRDAVRDLELYSIQPASHWLHWAVTNEKLCLSFCCAVPFFRWN